MKGSVIWSTSLQILFLIQNGSCKHGLQPFFWFSFLTDKKIFLLFSLRGLFPFLCSSYFQFNSCSFFLSFNGVELRIKSYLEKSAIPSLSVFKKFFSFVSENFFKKHCKFLLRYDFAMLSTPKIWTNKKIQNLNN